MNDLRKTTITTLEVAEMMEVEHKRLLRKLEGDKDRKGYIQIMTEAQMGLSDYFIPSSYRDASGRENKCYKVTKLGCDFLANKSTGEKGVLFTARYVKRFYEMENSTATYPINSAVLKGLANSGNLLRNVMKDEGAKPHEVAIVLDSLFRQSGVVLPECFVKRPEYEQMALWDYKVQSGSEPAERAE